MVLVIRYRCTDVVLVACGCLGWAIVIFVGVEGFVFCEFDLCLSDLLCVLCCFDACWFIW